jgi:chromosome segregation ATPase
MSELPPEAQPPAGDEPAEPPAEHRSAARNPWLWATAVVAVIAIVFGALALNERSKADDAKSDLAAEQKKAEPAQTTTTSVTVTAPQQTTSTQETQTESSDDNGGVHLGAIAAAVAAFGSARKQLNENDEQIDELESDVDKANAEADKATQEADKAKEQASTASDAQKKAEAEADQAEAEKRTFRAKAQAAAACAKSMLEIVGDIPKASNIDEGLQKAGDDVKALAPKCKESVASAGS